MGVARGQDPSQRSSQFGTRASGRTRYGRRYALRRCTMKPLVLPEPNPELATLLGDLFVEIDLQLVYQPVRDVTTGETLDGRQREAFAKKQGWRIEPTAIKTTSPEQRELLRIALNLTT